MTRRVAAAVLPLLYLVAWTRSRSTILIPLIYAVLGGFRDHRSDLRRTPSALPDPWVFSNYTDILEVRHVLAAGRQQHLIAVVTTCWVPLARAAAFVFARFAFPGREASTCLHARAAVPGRGGDPAAVHLVRDLGLLDNPLGVALPQAAFGLPTDDRHPAPVLRAASRRAQEAAAIDGCGPFRFFWRILLPLARPVLATVRCWRSSPAGTTSCSR